MPRKPHAHLSPEQHKGIIDDLRAGVLTVARIAEKWKVDYYKVYRMRDKLGGGSDLHGDVIEKVNDGAIALRMADNANDAVVVDANAQVILELMRDHSTLVKRARNVSVSLLEDLETTIRNREQIEQAIDVETADDQSPVRAMQMKRAVSLPVNTKTLADLANAMKTLIGLEREIFQIGKNDDGDKKGAQSLEDYVLSLPGESTRVDVG